MASSLIVRGPGVVERVGHRTLYAFGEDLLEFLGDDARARVDGVGLGGHFSCGCGGFGGCCGGGCEAVRVDAGEVGLDGKSLDGLEGAGDGLHGGLMDGSVGVFE